MVLVEPFNDSHSPLKEDVEVHNPSSSAAPASTAPPPYTPVPPPNPIPSYQAIPQSHPVDRLVNPSESQAIVITLPPSRQSPIRRFLVAFAVAGLVLLLWGAFMDSLGMVRRSHFRHKHYASEREGFPCPCQLPKEMDDTGRVLPSRYPLNQPPPRQMTG